MKKTLYIHIGTGKTGTTALQNTCEVNMNVLQEKYDVTFIENGHGFSKTSNNVNRKDKNRIKLTNKNLEELKTKIKDGITTRYMISSENFPGETKAEVDYIKKLLSGICEIKVIVYLRSQDTYIWSWYAEIVKELQVGKKLKAQVAELYRAERILNYEMLLENWNLIGAENIMINIYPPGENLIVNFFKNLQININTEDLKSLPRQNTSLQSEQIVLIQKLLPFIVKEKNEFELVEEIRKPFDIKFNYTKSLLSPEQRRNIINDFEKYNNKVANLYLNKKVLFEDDTIKDEETWCYPIIFQNGYIEEILKSDKISSKLKNLIKSKLLA